MTFQWTDRLAPRTESCSLSNHRWYQSNAQIEGRTQSSVITRAFSEGMPLPSKCGEGTSTNEFLGLLPKLKRHQIWQVTTPLNASNISNIDIDMGVSHRSRGKKSNNRAFPRSWETHVALYLPATAQLQSAQAPLALPSRKAVA